MIHTTPVSELLLWATPHPLVWGTRIPTGRPGRPNSPLCPGGPLGPWKQKKYQASRCQKPRVQRHGTAGLAHVGSVAGTRAGSREAEEM